MLRWYAIQSKPRKEDLLCEQLELSDIEAYFPRIRVQPVNPRARKFRAYFPGYLFVHVDLEQIGISVLQWMPGSIGVVNFDGDPAYIPDALLQAIRQRVEKINLAGVDKLEKLKSGDAVVIKDGPFAGHEAIFDTRLSGNERVRVLLELLRGQQIRLELPAGQIGL
jgi:transcription elongation factor/antiterminator RfaH